MEAGTTHATPKAGGIARVVAVILALVLAFITAVAVIVVVDIGELTPCQDVTSPAQLNDEGECYDGSDGEKTIAQVLGWPGAALAALAALMALAFAVRGRGGRPLLIVIAVAVVLLGLTLIIG